jgi:hypothetical protein
MYYLSCRFHFTGAAVEYGPLLVGYNKARKRATVSGFKMFQSSRTGALFGCSCDRRRTLFMEGNVFFALEGCTVPKYAAEFLQLQS